MVLEIEYTTARVELQTPAQAFYQEQFQCFLCTSPRFSTSYAHAQDKHPLPHKPSLNPNTLDEILPSHSKLVWSKFPTRRLPPAEDLEDQIEELHQRYPDHHIHRNLQPATGLLSPTQQVGDLFCGLLQRIGQLFKVLQ
jgi:hypothetical protein